MSDTTLIRHTAHRFHVTMGCEAITTLGLMGLREVTILGGTVTAPRMTQATRAIEAIGTGSSKTATVRQGDYAPDLPPLPLSGRGRGLYTEVWNGHGL